MQQNHQRREQSRHQADETVVMGKLTKAGAMLLADPIMVEHLEMLERREVKQHHDEQHLRARELAGALPCRLLLLRDAMSASVGDAVVSSDRVVPRFVPGSVAPLAL